MPFPTPALMLLIVATEQHCQFVGASMLEKSVFASKYDIIADSDDVIVNGLEFKVIRKSLGSCKLPDSDHPLTLVYLQRHQYLHTSKS